MPQRSASNGKDLQFVVTDKRIIMYVDGKFNDILYENIVSINEPITVQPTDIISQLTDIGVIGYRVIVTTYDGDIPIFFDTFSLANHFSDTANLCFDNYSFHRKDITALLCFANI